MKKVVCMTSWPPRIKYVADCIRALQRASMARTDEHMSAILLVGMHELLYAIAEQLGCFDEENDDD